MSVTKSIVPLRLELHRSWWLAALLLLMHSGALLIVVLVPLPLWAKGLLGTIVIASATTSLNTHALRRGKHAMVCVIWDGTQQWTLRTAAGEEFTARLLPGSYVAASLVILNFALKGRWRRRSVVILPDALDANSFRQLRVYLRTRFTRQAVQDQDSFPG